MEKLLVLESTRAMLVRHNKEIVEHVQTIVKESGLDGNGTLVSMLMNETQSINRRIRTIDYAIEDLRVVKDEA